MIHKIYHRPIVHIVLSLLLLLSQQIAILHVMSHWPDGRVLTTQMQPAGNTVSKMIVEPYCDQCLTFGQIAFALNTAALAFAELPHAATPIVILATQKTCLRTDCVFQSRAPPQA